MNYTELYQQLKAQYNPSASRTDFMDSDISCIRASFESKHISSLPEEMHPHTFGHGVLSMVDDPAIPENKVFSYPVFMREGSSQNKRAIILLHGLNERSWSKYLAWAYYLTQHTGRPVILLPIAFHMNRSPEAWSDPRKMISLLAERRLRLGDIPRSTFANLALSDRLSEDPLRFFTSGEQSASDLVQLTQQLSIGTHPLFEKGTTVDFFAYSIGAFLAQILLLGNPGGLYADSKFFLFCGGAMFDKMNGVSKLIMDQNAFDRLRQFYISELDEELKRYPKLAGLMNYTPVGKGFLSMLSLGNLQDFRENIFFKKQDHIQAVALLKDKVIPATGISEALNPFINVEVKDFPYGYTHENPFPVFGNETHSLVNSSFEEVFAKASAFLK
jgi:pimeloyl-ACP methyl ester carboxylesterase